MKFRAVLAWDAKQTEAETIEDAREIFDNMVMDGELASGWDNGEYELWVQNNGEWERVMEESN